MRESLLEVLGARRFQADFVTLPPINLLSISLLPLLEPIISFKFNLCLIYLLATTETLRFERCPLQCERKASKDTSRSYLIQREETIPHYPSIHNLNCQDTFKCNLGALFEGKKITIIPRGFYRRLSHLRIPVHRSNIQRGYSIEKQAKINENSHRKTKKKLRKRMGEERQKQVKNTEKIQWKSTKKTTGFPFFIVISIDERGKRGFWLHPSIMKAWRFKDSYSPHYNHNSSSTIGSQRSQAREWAYGLARTRNPLMILEESCVWPRSKGNTKP